MVTSCTGTFSTHNSASEEPDHGHSTSRRQATSTLAESCRIAERGCGRRRNCRFVEIKVFLRLNEFYSLKFIKNGVFIRFVFRGIHDSVKPMVLLRHMYACARHSAISIVAFVLSSAYTAWLRVRSPVVVSKANNKFERANTRCKVAFTDERRQLAPSQSLFVQH